MAMASAATDTTDVTLSSKRKAPLSPCLNMTTSPVGVAEWLREILPDSWAMKEEVCNKAEQGTVDGAQVLEMSKESEILDVFQVKAFVIRRKLWLAIKAAQLSQQHAESTTVDSIFSVDPLASSSVDNSSSAKNQTAEIEAAVVHENEVIKELQSSLKRCRQSLVDPKCVGWASRSFLASKTSELDQLDKDLALPGMSVVVVGNTGAGKSTLLNSLLGESSVLPTNGMRACTAVLLRCSYDYSEDQSSSLYKGEVNMIGKQEWLDELEDILAELTTQEGRAILTVGEKQHNYQSWCKLYSVYGTYYTYNSAPSGEVDHNDKPIYKPLMMKDLYKKLLAKKSVMDMLGKKINVEANDALTFRKKLEGFMDSANIVAGGQLWPLVKEVKISSKKWTILKTGCVLVDAPGVNDSNSSRDAVVRQYLKTADSVWIVSNINRAVNDKTAKDMLDKNFRRQLLMDGKMSNSLVFIATQSDVLQEAEIVRSLKLPLGTTTTDCARARNKFTAARIKRDFIDGLVEMAVAAGDAVDRSDFEARFNLPTFCVSSMDYQKVTGIRAAGDGKPEAFSDALDTQIPALRQYVLDATLSQRTRKISLFGNRLKEMMDSLIQFCNGMSGLKPSQRKLAEKAFDDSIGELRSSTHEHRQTFRQLMLDEFTSSLIPSLKQGALTSAADAHETAQGWGSSYNSGVGLHWATYKATVRRQGVFRRNMNEELTQPIMECVSTRWERVFVSKLQAHLVDTSAKCRESVRVFGKTMQRLLSECGLQDDAFNWGHLQTFATSMLSKATDDIKAKVEHEQKDLSRSITPSVQTEMGPAYSQAFGEAGTGSHRRRCALMEAFVLNHKEVLFVNSIEPIIVATVPLLKELVRFLEMAEIQYRQEFSTLCGIFWETPSVESTTARAALKTRLEVVLQSVTQTLTKIKAAQVV
eukprot:m.220660 g.220660  ORF g.220660 m.220660 type:complete len:926 (+) comp33324_c1_seq1:67-2844(+)